MWRMKEDKHANVRQQQTMRGRADSSIPLKNKFTRNKQTLVVGKIIYKTKSRFIVAILTFPRTQWVTSVDVTLIDRLV